MTSIQRTPKPLSVILSLGAGLLAVLLVANGAAQASAVGLEAVGLAVGVSGVFAYRARHRVIGTALALGGVSLAIAAIGVGWLRAPDATAQVELVPGMAGLVLLAGGVVCLRRGWDRYLVMAGTGLLLIGVLLSGVVHGASRPFLLAGAVATVVAWDVGEQGINLGEQVGRRASTWSSELVHTASSVVVGGVGIGLAFGVYAVGFDRIPLVGLLLLLAGAVTLTVALYS